MTFSLDQARAEAAQKYSDFEMELSDGSSVTLKAPLNLDRSKREKLSEIRTSLQAANETGNDSAALSHIMDMFRCASADEEKAEELISELSEEPMSTIMVVLNAWQGQTQTGEA